MMVSVALMCAVSPNIAAVDICVLMNVETESTYDITYTYYLSTYLIYNIDLTYLCMQMIALLPISTTTYLDDIRFVQVASLHCKTITLMKDTK